MTVVKTVIKQKMSDNSVSSISIRLTRATPTTSSIINGLRLNYFIVTLLTRDVMPGRNRASTLLSTTSFILLLYEYKLYLK